MTTLLGSLARQGTRSVAVCAGHRRVPASRSSRAAAKQRGA